MSTVLPSVTLVLGGARSGKSGHAESLIEAAGGGTYIATAEAWDDEMKERIRLHRDRRGGQWHSIEAPIAIADAIADANRPVLVDCLTIWLSNLMHYELDADAEIARLVETLASPPQPVVLVSNELGLGIVPENALARRFRDMHGRMNQMVAAAASRVLFVAAGLPLELKTPLKDEPR